MTGRAKTGGEFKITFREDEKRRLKWNEPGPSGDMGGYQDMENWLISNIGAGGVCVLTYTMLGRLIVYILRFGPGGPNQRIRDACLGPLRRSGITLLGWT